MHQVATLASLEDGRATTVEIGDVRIMLVRDGAEIRAFSAECPHAGAPLAEGAVCDGRIICPWHKASFSLQDGTLLEPPALEGLARYPVAIERGIVLVSPEPIEPPLPPQATADGRTMVIVGAGAAGVAAACALREFNFSGRIILLGREPGDPYDRTALSKFVLEGGMPPEKTPPLRAPGFYDAHRIERMHGEASDLIQSTRTLMLADGRSVQYDDILIATGGLARGLDVPGAGLPHVRTLRSREDVQEILGIIGDGEPQVVVAGSGFIGLEAASALRARGLAVTIVSPQLAPFTAQFGEQLGQFFRRLHETHGVRYLGGRRIDRIESGQVVLDDQSRIDAGLVLVGLGIEPATAFARGLDKTADGGIIVDAALRAADHVFAAGDVARFPLGAQTQVHVEHWRVAQQLGRIAASNMLGIADMPNQAPFFWTYHYGKRYEYIGHPEGFDSVELDGDPDAGDFLARLTRNGKTVAIVACGREAQTAALLGTLTAA